MVTELLY